LGTFLWSIEFRTCKKKDDIYIYIYIALLSTFLKMMRTYMNYHYLRFFYTHSKRRGTVDAQYNSLFFSRRTRGHAK